MKFEKAHERVPQNHFDLSIMTDTCEWDFSRTQALPPVEKIDVPGIPGAFALQNVLSPHDCKQIRDMAEQMGFELDVPIGGETDQRARGCVWVASQLLHDLIFERVAQIVPEKLEG